MKKLKIDLLCKIILIVTCFYTFYITKNLIYHTNYKEGEITLIGKIINITKKENNVDLIIKAKEKIKVTYYGSVNYQLGDYVKIKGTLTKPYNSTIFNLFDYRNYLLSDKIYFILKADKIDKYKDNDNIFYKIKNSIYEKIDKLKSKNYVKTFILGDKQDLNDEILNSYQQNGVSHLLAISGMHISLLVVILSKILKKFKYSYFIISIFLIFYAFLTNFTPSVLRAVLLYIFNKIDKKNLILLIASLMLFYNPYYIYNVGFLFSFIISFYLIYFGNLTNKFNNYFIKLFMTSTICFIASIPIMINNFYYINITSPLINIMFVPFISLIIFPLSLITLVFPILDNILFFLLNIMESLTLFFNNFNINLTMAKMNIYIFIIYYLIITLIFIKPKYFYALIFILIIHNNIKYFNKNSYLTILDVGQGDSILLEIKDKNILIDTGGNMFSDYNIAKNKLIPYFKSLGIKKINYLILTHGDYDHMGESINLVNNFKVEKVIFNCGPHNDLEQELIKVLHKKKIPYYSCIKELNIDDNKLYFLNNKDYGNENDNSSVIYTELNKHKFLFMGDAGVEVEDDLIEKYNLQNIDVLKVGHHGSKTSSSEEFIGEINPKYSVISVGKNNRYGHPNDSVLENLEDSKIYRTDEDGSIMFKIDNDKLKIKTCAP
ncbi:MAG TPA: DNA internalization-related competence protein ComEC/Rec2 [Candidatus Faecisoma merdavium]|nr:DNA internalization-related competence protein ComEC/Rec2 [Candidatus Faecisoma merdavium]